MERFERLFVTFNRVLVATLLAAVFVIVFANVIGRYLFGVSLAWGEEVARFLMIFGVFAGAGLALRSGRLVEISLITSLLPTPLGTLLRWGTVAVMAAFMALMFWYGVEFVSFGWNKETMATGISRGIPYLALPIGAVLFLCNLALFARNYVRGEFELESQPGEPEA